MAASVRSRPGAIRRWADGAPYETERVADAATSAARKRLVAA